MRGRLLPWALLMWVASPGCADGDRDLPRAYRRLGVPRALVMSPDARRRGRALFADHCALCHGERGDGQGLRKEGLTRRVFFAIREGLQGTPMPAWKSLSEQDTWDLTAYLLSIGAPE